MATLKNTQKDAGSLLATFLGICIYLSRDEIFFWSRSEDDFKKLLLLPISELLSKMPDQSVSVSKKQHRLDESPYHSQIDLYCHFVEACRSMSGEQVKFWLKPKSRGLLMSLLRKREIEFLPVIDGKAYLPAWPEGRTADSFRSKNFKQDQFRMHDACEKLHSKYAASEVSEVSCFKIACSLTGDEMILYAGGAEAVAEVTFTPEQVRYLASQQRRMKDKGLLLYEGSNYFPILGKDKTLRMVSLQWLKPTFPGDDKIGRWHYWVLDTHHECRPLGRFFVRC